MLTRRASALSALVLAGSAAAAQAQSVTLTAPSLSPADRQSITVRAGGPPFPDEGLVSQAHRYVIVYRTADDPIGKQIPVTAAAPEPGLYEVMGLIRISLSEAVPAAATAIDVISLFEKPARVTWVPRKPAGTTGPHGVARKDQADVYLFGSWVSGVDLAPVYSLDLVLGAPVHMTERWKTTARATFKTADRRDIDPDAYSIAISLGRRYPKALRAAGPYLDFQWSLMKLEFSRKDEASNLLTSPVLTYSVGMGRSLRDDRTVRAAAYLDVEGGVELGKNLRNKAVPGGYGTIARLVPGIGFHASFPRAFGLDELRWTTVYRARVLLTQEPMIDARDDEHPRAGIEKGTRHEWRDELTAKVTSYLGISLKHEYGSLPPAFKVLDHRFSAGATVMWAWR